MSDESKVDALLDKADEALGKVKPIADLAFPDKSDFGLVELKELVHALELLGVAGGKIWADKKLGLDDLASLKDLVDQSGELLEGFKGLDDAMVEIKDLDAGEAVELAQELVKAVKAIKASL